MASVASRPRRPFSPPSARPGGRSALWLVALGVVLLAASIFVRTRAAGGALWMDEGLSIGIASHPLSEIPEVLLQDGSPPLYYLLLHGWMTLFGDSESATHALSVLFATLCIPAAGWAGWSLFDSRTGLIAAALAAFNPFLTVYATETRMYSLVALLSILAGAAFLHAFVFRRRRHLVLFAVALAAMLYTHNWGPFFGLGCAAALVPCWLVSDDRRGLLRDAVLGFGGAALLFAPWVPSLLAQVGRTGAPWTTAPRFGAPALIAHWLLGGTGPTVAVGVGVGIGLLAVKRAGTRAQWTVVLAAIVAFVATLAVAWLYSQTAPAWNQRYFAAVLGPLLVVLALGFSRGGRLGLIALVVVIVLWNDPRVDSVGRKSNARDLAAQIAPALRRGDLVVSTQPEQVALLHYELPGGLGYATTLSAERDPTVLDWRDAMDRLRAAAPRAQVARVVGGLRPGQRLLFVRPITEFADNWQAPWTQLIRRRSAEWGGLLARDPRLWVVGTAPSHYRQVNFIGVHGVLYERKPGR